MVETEFLADIERPDLVDAWDEISRLGGCPGVFACRPWVSAWAAAFRADAEPEVAVARENGTVVGILPLFRRSDRRLTTHVNFLSHRGEMTALPGRETEALRAVLGAARSRGDTIALRGLPGGSPTRAAVRETAAGAGYVETVREGRSSPVVDVQDSWDAYYASRPRKVTHEWERKIRKLGRAGDVVVGNGHADDTDALVGAFADIEDASWKHETGTSIRGRGMESFYRDVSRRLAEAGWLHPWWVELDGRMIAFLYGVEVGGTYYALKTSYLTETRKLSPGVLLFRDAIRDAFERGLARFDFVGQPARWKDEWATGRLAHDDVTLHPDDAAGRARAVVEGCLKPAARSVRDRLRGRENDGGRR